MHYHSAHIPIPTILRGPGARTKTILGPRSHRAYPTPAPVVLSDPGIRPAHQKKPIIPYASSSSRLAG